MPKKQVPNDFKHILNLLMLRAVEERRRCRTGQKKYFGGSEETPPNFQAASSESGSTYYSLYFAPQKKAMDKTMERQQQSKQYL